MPSEKETIRVNEPPGNRPGRLRLFVLGKGDVHHPHSLPEKGLVSVGRSSGVDVRIDDPLISRKHVLLCVGDALEVQDLGSANGTYLRGRRLEPRERAQFAPGDAIEIGATLLVVQRIPGGVRPLRILTPEYFEARIQDELERAERTGGSFAVVRISLGTGPKEDALDALAAAIRPGDVVAQSGPGRYQVLLVDTAEDAARSWVSALATALPRASIGLAGAPLEARTPAAPFEPGDPAPRESASLDDTSSALVASTGAMERLRSTVELVARSPINVLILGETGVGKGVLARQIHLRSPRAQRPFVNLNCAALAESLLESELFGHEKGAFTGASQAKPGLLESADGGTLFLDEIGEMPLSMQAKLLRVIEDREVRRVGSVRTRTVDVRIIAATNRDLELDTARGAFRADLFFRLNGIAFTVPPLRERLDEIEPLARGFAAEEARRLDREPPRITGEAMAALQRLSWPGNIRELRNAIQRAVALCADGPITPEHLPEQRVRIYYPRAEQPSTDSPAREDSAPNEKQRIVAALNQCAGNQTRAARLLGISLRTLQSRLTRYGIPRPRQKHGST